MAYQIGVAPVRIDILTHVSGIQFAEVWQNRAEDNFFGVPVNVISFRDLILNKKSTGRSSDLEQLKRLENVLDKER